MKFHYFETLCIEEQSEDTPGPEEIVTNAKTLIIGGKFTAKLIFEPTRAATQLPQQLQQAPISE